MKQIRSEKISLHQRLQWYNNKSYYTYIYLLISPVNLKHQKGKIAICCKKIIPKTSLFVTMFETLHVGSKILVF